MKRRVAAVASRAARLILALGLGACSSLPALDEVQPTLPGQFLASGSAPAPAAWWRELQDPELDRLVAEALRESLSLQQIAARLRAAQANAGIAKSQFIPDLTLSAERLEPVDSADGDASSSVGLAASYELDLWGRLRAGQRSAQRLAQATEQELKAAQISLSAQITTQWLRIGNARQRLALIEQERLSYERTLELVELRFRQGQLSASDLLRQRQLLASTLGREALAQSDLGILKHALSELLGRVAGAADWAGYQQQQLLPLPAAGLPAEVVQRRPDVQQAWLQVLAADADVAAAIAQRFPQLNLGASLSSSSAGPAALFDNWISSLSASLLGPLVDGGRRRRQVDRQRALLEQKLAAYRQSVLAAMREIQDALLQDRYQQQRLSSLQTQLRFSDAGVERLLKQLRSGRVDYLAVLDGQISNSALRRELLSAQQQAQELRVSVYRATAGPVPEAAYKPQAEGGGLE